MDYKPRTFMSTTPQSWADLVVLPPADPRSLIADAKINGVQGTFTRSTDFLNPTWVDSPHTITSATCSAHRTDDLQMVADAAMWNFAHQTVNTLTTLAIPMRKVLFLRGYEHWLTMIQIAVSGNMTNPQISFRDNAASSGDFTGSATGSIPAIRWTGTFTGTVMLELTLKQLGRFSMALKSNDTTNHSMLEMERTARLEHLRLPK